MSRLLRLYPAAWRARYGSELNAILRERPIGVGGRIDLVRGAIDAHRHPEIIGMAPQPWTHRLPGLLATGAGLTWSWFWVRVWQAAPGDEWGDAIGIALLLMLVSLPGDYLAGYGRRVGVGIACVAGAMVLGRALPWDVGGGLLNFAAGATAYYLLGGGMLAMAAIRAGIASRGRWLLVGTAVIAPAPVVISILGGFGPGDSGGPAALMLAVLPYGIAWTLVGVRMTFRGSATIVDLPTHRDAEVLAT